MRLVDFYKLVVKKGIAKDPRSASEIKDELKRVQKEYRGLKGPDKKAFDKEALTNPYADTRVLNGNPDTNIKTLMVGIDMEMAEIILADRLNEKGEAIDLVMAHHPEGVAWAKFYDVMRLQVAMLKNLGIAADVAEEMLKERMGEVERSVAPANHLRSVDVARLLDMPYMCVHTPADNHVASYLQKLFDGKTPEKLSQVLGMLKAIPEYFDGMKKNSGPRILIGEPKKKAGKIYVDMTGGTEGPKKVFGRLSQAGVGTIVAMHLSEEHFKHAKGEHINVVIAGHIASDTLGLNLLLDEVEKTEKLKIIPASGFIRVKR
jgi:hypothetical protein